MTDRPIISLKGVKLSQPVRDMLAEGRAAEVAFVAAMDRANREGKKVRVRVVYPEPRRSVR